MDEQDVEKEMDRRITKTIEKVLSERDEKLKNKSDVEQLSGKIDKALAKRSSKPDDSGGHVDDDHTHDAPHQHATHSSDENCPTCGDKNPDYNSDQAVCKDCGEPVGTVAEIEKGDVTTCRSCGGHEAEHKSRGYSL